MMSISEICGALKESAVERFDFICFYACLMSSVEDAVMLSLPVRIPWSCRRKFFRRPVSNSTECWRCCGRIPGQTALPSANALWTIPSYVYKEALNLAKIYHADETIVALGGIRIREYYDDIYAHCTVVDYNIDVKKALREHPEYEHRISVDYVV